VGQVHLHPDGRARGDPNFARGCPFTCSFCSQWKFWRDYRMRDPKKVVDEIESLVRDHQVGFFILADEEPTIHRKKFIAFCEELIERDLPVLWGINTRVTDILRDEKLLPMFRKAGPDPRVAGHRGGGAAEAGPLQQGDHDRPEQEGDQLLREAGIVTEAQFIVGLENETAETLEETYRWRGLEARHGQLGDVHALAVQRPVPGARRQGRGVRLREVQLRHADHEARRDGPRELLDRVMNNYRRFYMNKTFFQYPWDPDKAPQVHDGLPEGLREERLRAHLLRPGRVGYWGPQSKKKVDFALCVATAGQRDRVDRQRRWLGDDAWTQDCAPKRRRDRGGGGR
jgi:anaerobic magnesium-protoporphyrin IX monomethyl ester cyclase